LFLFSQCYDIFLFGYHYDNDAITLPIFSIKNHYRPKISKKEAAQRSVAKVLQKFFDGSPRALVAHLIDANAISPDELSSLQQLLISKQKENQE